MKNALRSNFPVPSQFYNINGNSEAQMSYLDVLMQVETKGNVHGDAFYLETKTFNNGNQLRDGALSHFNSYSQDYQFGDNDFQPSLTNKLEIPHFEMDIQNLQSRKKRPIEVYQDQTTHQISRSELETDDFMLNMPIRKRQKLSDKITALQKLVSPYGKSDTASVLQEASLHIKLLQEKIQNLFQMMSSSYNSTVRAIHPLEIEQKQQDLRSRGLCLVPISFSQKVTNDQEKTI